MPREVTRSKTTDADASDLDSDASTVTPVSPTRSIMRKASETTHDAPPSSASSSASDDTHSNATSDTSSALDHGPALIVAPLLPWVTVLIRYLGRPVVVTCLARAYLATLSFSATLDVVRFCAAGHLGPERSYGVLEYQHGRWKQPMALQVVLRHDRVAVPAAQGAADAGGAEGAEDRGPRREVHRETFVASCYPEEGWKFLADSVESLELVVDPNFD